MDPKTEKDFLRRVVESQILPQEQHAEAVRIVALCDLLCRVHDMYDDALRNASTYEQLRLRIKEQL